jgi:arsenate reductase (thioredoxin)
MEVGMNVSIILMLSFAATATLVQVTHRKPRLSGTVVFVCEHGTVKSLIASEWFNRLAAERGLDVRAAPRGVTPDASVPPAIAEALREEGFDVSTFEPRAFGTADASVALRVVGIGVDLSAAVRVPLETWQGIPPAGPSYAATRDALRTRIEVLLKTLEGARP